MIREKDADISEQKKRVENAEAYLANARNALATAIAAKRDNSSRVEEIEKIIELNNIRAAQIAAAIEAFDKE